MFYIAFWFVVVVALCQLFWQAVIAPVVRVRKRLRLFAIRDEIRFQTLLAMRAGTDVTELQELERFTNNGIYLIHHFGLIDFAISRPQNVRPKKFRDEASEEFRRRIIGHVMTCLFVNSVPMLIYLIPLAMTYRASTSLSNLLARPEKELARIFPYDYCRG